MLEEVLGYRLQLPVLEGPPRVVHQLLLLPQRFLQLQRLLQGLVLFHQIQESRNRRQTHLRRHLIQRVLLRPQVQRQLELLAALSS
jgi:hypothetical protein